VHDVQRPATPVLSPCPSSAVGVLGSVWRRRPASGAGRAGSVMRCASGDTASGARRFSWVGGEGGVDEPAAITAAAVLCTMRSEACSAEFDEHHDGHRAAR